MIGKIQHATASSPEGAKGLVKGVLACAFQNMAFMLPTGLLYLLVKDLLAGSAPAAVARQPARHLFQHRQHTQLVHQRRLRRSQFAEQRVDPLGKLSEPFHAERHRDPAVGTHHVGQHGERRPGIFEQQGPSPSGPLRLAVGQFRNLKLRIDRHADPGQFAGPFERPDIIGQIFIHSTIRMKSFGYGLRTDRSGRRGSLHQQVAPPDFAARNTSQHPERPVAAHDAEVFGLYERTRIKVRQIDDVDPARPPGRQRAERIVQITHRHPHPRR